MRKNEIVELLRCAKKHHRAHARTHLPWRTTRNPYRILVSEVMLQQTQVERVAPLYAAFVRRFPTIRALGRAALPEVLRLWQGLGYNRRAKMLRDAARMIENDFGGRLPRDAHGLEALPGVGPYTARAVAAFAFNQPEIFVETNIRTAFFYHCFAEKEDRIFFSHIPPPALHGPQRSDPATFRDSELLPLVAQALRQSRMEPRDFYAMLMDYGAFLKKSGVKLNAKSAHYARQSPFQGSRRELRGNILKILLNAPHTENELAARIGRSSAEVRRELARLKTEKLIALRRGRYCIAA